MRREWYTEPPTGGNIRPWSSEKGDCNYLNWALLTVVDNFQWQGSRSSLTVRTIITITTTVNCKSLNISHHMLHRCTGHPKPPASNHFIWINDISGTGSNQSQLGIGLRSVVHIWGGTNDSDNQWVMWGPACTWGYTIRSAPFLQVISILITVEQEVVVILGSGLRRIIILQHSSLLRSRQFIETSLMTQFSVSFSRIIRTISWSAVEQTMGWLVIIIITHMSLTPSNTVDRSQTFYSLNFLQAPSISPLWSAVYKSHLLQCTGYLADCSFLSFAILFVVQ